MILFGMTFALAVMLGFVILLRWFASWENPTIAIIVPAQKHAFVTTSATEKGGNIVDVVHSWPGMFLNKSSADPMDWVYEDEVPDRRERRDLLFRLFGLQLIGLFRWLRTNNIRTFRYGRSEGEAEYHMMDKSEKTRYVFCTGQHDVLIKGVETKGSLKFDLLFNLLYNEQYPVRARLRVADPYAVMTMMATEAVIGTIGTMEPEQLIASDEQKKELVAKMQSITDAVEEQIGIRIRKVNLSDVSFDTETRRLLELRARTERENAAAIAIAEKDKQIQILANDADADRVERVIKPAAENERTVAVRIAEAYEGNKTVTTYAPGAGNTMIPLGK